MDTRPLLGKAKTFLKTHPRDDIHDLSHHERVWKNAQMLIPSANQIVDREVLEVATFWHDVMVTPTSLALGSHGLFEETVEYLKDLMNELGYEQYFQKKVLAALKQHNFLSKYQRTIESKLLFDADKLDALNSTRYQRIVKGIKTKHLSRLQINLLAQAAKLWLKTMRSRYHFEKSREMHDELIARLLKDTETVELAREWGVDIEKLVH